MRVFDSSTARRGCVTLNQRWDYIEVYTKASRLFQGSSLELFRVKEKKHSSFGSVAELRSRSIEPGCWCVHAAATLVNTAKVVKRLLKSIRKFQSPGYTRSPATLGTAFYLATR